MPWNFGLLGGAASSSLTIVTGGSLFSDVNYYYRVFTSSGTLSVQGSPIEANVLVVAGGGAGGVGNGSGSSVEGAGGGAGGFRTQVMSLSSGSYAVTVGAGGASIANGSNITGPSGSSSTFNSLTATGGGGGATRTSLMTSGGNGGSGGGGGYTGENSGSIAGTGIPGQGNNGGSGQTGNPYSGGGGGAGSAGVGASGGGHGGSGSQWLNGLYYAGGGGRGPGDVSTAGNGGIGGGGNGLNASSSQSAGVNTGGGGGGGRASALGNASSGAGGSGIVIIRYPKTILVQPPIGDIWASDSFASHLRIALPLNSVLGTADYSSSIKNSGTSRTATPVNNPLISGAQSKFYGSSLDNGTESQDRYISIPNSSDLTLGTSDFCIEGWWYFTNNNLGYQVLASHSGDTTDQQNGWVLTTETNNTLYFYATNTGGWPIAMGGSTTPTANTWHHVAVTRSGSNLRMFFNGTQIQSQNSSTSISLPNSREFRLGSYRYIPGYPQSFNGFIQDFRMYIGTPKYTSNFTPPGAMYLGA